KYGGKIVKNIGDSYMALFDSATDAMRGCMELVASSLEFSGENLSFRASAATGDVEEIDNDYFGEAVNLSARINSKTPSGQAWFANRTRMCLNQAEIPWEAVGSYEFKGIPEAIEVFRAVHQNQCILPDSIEASAQKGKFILITADNPDFNPKEIKSDRNIILSGFKLGSQPLRQIIARLPSTIPPGQIWICVQKIPSVERKAWLDMGRGLIVGTHEAMSDSISAAQKNLEEQGGSQTVFMDLTGEGDVSLQLVGLALPAVPMAGVIQGYSFDLLSDCSWGFSAENVLLRVEVALSGAYVVTLHPDVYINGRRVPLNTKEILRDGNMIRTPLGSIRYRALAGQYQGMLIGPETYTMNVNVGERIELGREPNFPGFTLPDRGGLDRIKWAPGLRAEKARQAGLTLDRSLTGRHQALFMAVTQTDFSVDKIHDRIPTWLFCNEKLERVMRACKAKFGDMLIIGTNVICISKPMM
ncbi:MAG: adenylate/guanylate cyclase domain-containing protein, partial [Myxococcota bacterium]|nr:adenylate/guanylate cyclase domain-containing protein [Myxococcota bacterium]